MTATLAPAAAKSLAMVAPMPLDAPVTRATVDRSYVMASGTMDRHLTYVAMTRHRDGVQLYVAHTVLFSEVRIHSFCHVEEAVLLPNVTVGRGCRLRRVVVDRNCQLPEGLIVGEDPVLDAQRFERTEAGVVLITKYMLKNLVL